MLKLKTYKNYCIILFILVSTVSLSAEVVKKDSADFLGSFYNKKGNDSDSDSKDSNPYLFKNWAKDREAFYKNKDKDRGLLRYKYVIDHNLEVLKLKATSLDSFNSYKLKQKELLYNYKIQKMQMGYKLKKEKEKKRDLELLYMHQCLSESLDRKDYCDSFVQFRFYYNNKLNEQKEQLKSSDTLVIKKNRKKGEKVKSDAVAER